jgi:hypothetical protein
MTRSQFYLVVAIGGLTLLGMIGIYYMLVRALKAYEQKQQEFKSNPLGTVLGLIS